MVEIERTVSQLGGVTWKAECEGRTVTGPTLLDSLSSLKLVFEIEALAAKAERS